MSIDTGPVAAPYSAAWCTRYETFALQISFLLGRQLTLGHEPPIHRRSTTAVDWPDDARCQARSLPPAPLPRTTFANDSAWCMLSSHLGRAGFVIPSPSVRRLPRRGRPASLGVPLVKRPASADRARQRKGRCPS